MELELCAYSVEAVRRAAAAGLTRVELCAEPALDGISPTDETLREALAVVRGARAARAAGSAGFSDGSRLRVNVMVRPRGGDFVYTDEEFGRMRREILRAREMGADGVVFGILTPAGDVDFERVRELVDAARGSGGSVSGAEARPLETTFHRAFDVARDWRSALTAIIEAGCTRLLTSGQAPTAAEGIDTLREIVAAAREGTGAGAGTTKARGAVPSVPRGRIEIMAGSGVDPANAAELIKTGVDALHFSARKNGHLADPQFIEEMKRYEKV